MALDLPRMGMELRSLLTSGGLLELSLQSAPVEPPAADEVVLRVEAAPINPSDLGLLLAGVDMTGAKISGDPAAPVVSAPAAAPVMRAMAARLDRSMPVGNEGAGVVVAAGSSPQAQALLGRTVAVFAGGMYAQYRTVKAQECLVLPADVTAEEGASCFVNPLTALGMVGTMRLEGHSALVHTAAASNLGQMLVKLCRRDGVELVNVVRRPEQAEMLRSLGATHICDSSSERFVDDLTEALTATGATLAFDAVGGGKLAGQILAGMETAILARGGVSERYGSSVHKQVYLYGSLDAGPTQIGRSFGLAWGVGGWLLTFFLKRIGPAQAQALREDVASGLKTTFASHYTRTVSLSGALQPDVIAAYGRRATGEKFLISPWLDQPAG
jgi:NADPH:quinone reductase-like Zn-dependent oxidoreductase